MGSTFTGLILLANAHRFEWMLVACALIGLGSAVSTRNPHVLPAWHRRTPRSCAIAVSGRWKFRDGTRAAARRFHRPASWAEERRLVQCGGSACHAGAVAGRLLVCRKKKGHGQTCDPACRLRTFPSRVVLAIAVSRGAGLFQVHLHGQPDELLHLLPDAQIRRQHPESQLLLFLFLALSPPAR